MTQEQIDALKAQGYHFKATAAGEVQFTPEEEAEWAGREAAAFPQRKADKLTELGRVRWEKTQTFSYDGETGVPADPALSVITSLSVSEQFASSGGATRNFKLKSPAVFRQWNIDQIVAYGMAIGEYVQDCFDREEELATLINAATDQAALDAIDIATGWPE